MKSIYKNIVQYRHSGSRSLSIKKVVASVVAVLIVPVLTAQLAMGYNLDYRNKTMYFSGHTIAGDWSPPAGVSSVDPIYNGGQFPDATTEPGVNGSAGYVIPNKAATFAQIGDSSNAGGAGGAIGFDALGLTDSGSGMRNDPQRKQKLYDLLVSLNQSGTNWEKMGSAFDIYKMIQHAPAGGPWVGASQTISPTNLQELHDRLVANPNITMTYDPSYTVLNQPNTNGVQYLEGGVWKYDVIDNVLEDSGGDSAVQPAWVFRDASNGNNIVLVLEVNCANSIGSFASLADFEPQMDLELDKAVDGNNDGIFNKSEAIKPDVPFSYRVTLRNTGNVQATGVAVRDMLPAGMTLQSYTASQGSASPSSGLAPLVTWTIGTVAPGAEHTLILKVVVNSADLPAYNGALVDGVVRNLAQVTAANETDIDSTPDNIDTPYIPANREDDEDYADVFMTVLPGAPNTGLRPGGISSIIGLVGLSIAMLLVGAGIYRRITTR